MPSPVRRSTRAAQPSSNPLGPASSASSSSLSSAKADRNMRVGGPVMKSVTPRSLSSEDPSEPPRRSKRSHAHQEEEDEEAVTNSKEHGTEIADEEEITRCVCGQQEYPGPPQSEAFSATEAQSEDAGGLFIQCDGCSVWQHGGCVGIVEESQCPDKYYCEACRPKQHDVRTDARGQHYSLYLPLHPKARRKSSTSKHEDKAKRERESAASRASTEPGRRRATMRSKEHDDEEEQILRAIEESKRDAADGSGKRSGKRSRDDSEDSKQESKRQRRASESLPAALRAPAIDDLSEDDQNLPLTASKAKKARADAALTARNVELREKEKERERARAEAAGRRQERAGRRRTDEEGADETPNPQGSPPPSSQPSPGPPQQPMPKKGKKTKKLGNNQYTKARELAQAGIMSSPHSKKRHLVTQTMVNGDEHTAGADKNSPVYESTNGSARPRHGKGKNRVVNGRHAVEELEKTIPNMKRALDGMQAFITRTQVEMAGNEGFVQSQAIVPSGRTRHLSPADGAAAQPVLTLRTGAEKSFDSLSAMEMADVLSRNIHRWQNLYGGVTT